MENCLHIDEIDKKDTARVGWAIETVLKRQPPNNIITKIAASITANKEYSKEPHLTLKNDWNIIKNRDYKKPGFWSRYPFYEKLAIALISGGISLMVGLAISKQSKQSQSLKDTQQDSLIQVISDSLSSLGNRFDTLK